MANLRLTIAARTYPYTAAVKSGEIKIKGVDLELVEVEPQIAAYRRMVREVEFDMCELAPTTYIIAKAYGAPFTSLPIFFGRRFHHDGMMVRDDSNIKVPKDLEGKKVGVRAHSVTTAVWTRGIFQNEYGLDTSKVTWYVDDEEHVREIKLPPNVLQVPEGKSLASMIASGEIVAGFAANAGIGREGKPTANWDQRVKIAPPPVHDLMPNAKTEAAAWFKRTGILPAHGALVIKDELLNKHPDLAKDVYDAFFKAKQQYMEKLKGGQLTGKEDKALAATSALVGGDPVPYGLEANRPTIQALIDYAYQQGLTPRKMKIEEVFLNF